jgi:membrane fusion protein, multidrug efflux system
MERTMSAPHAENLSAGTARSARGYLEPAGGTAAIYTPLWKRALWIVLGLLLVGLLIWLVRPSEKGTRAAGGFGMSGPMPVAVAKAASGDVRVTLNALGAVTPLATVTVKPQVSGTIQKINFQEGQMVHSGDILAEIDPRPYQAALDQAKGALARDQAQYENAGIDLKRYQTLWAQNAISQQVLATQEALVRTDAGTVEADKGAVEAAGVNLAYCKITSPVAGRVGLRQVDIGNYVQVGVTTAIVVVTELQPMSVLFTLPEDYIEQVMGRVHAGATLPVDAYDRSQSVMIATGTLSTVDNEVDPTTGTVKMRALFNNSDNRLFPSQFVNVRLLVNTLHGQTTVPTPAVQHGASGDYVFVVNPDRTVSMRTVQLGETDGDKVDVLNGLSPGTTVVVDGADRLRDGSSVVIPRANGSAPTLAGTKLYKRAWHHRHWNGGGGAGSAGGQ